MKRRWTRLSVTKASRAARPPAWFAPKPRFLPPTARRSSITRPDASSRAERTSRRRHACSGCPCRRLVFAEGRAELSAADDRGDQREQVGVVGLLAGGGQHRMDLPAVMGLVVEEMGDQKPQRSTHLAIGRTAEPGEVLGEP